MDPHGTPDVDRPQEATLHPPDENVRNIMITGSSLALAVILVSLLLLWLFNAYDARERRQDPLPHPLLDSVQVPPEPRLQENPGADLQRIRAEERKILESYDWVDRGSSVVRIPVERAQELLLQRGLPARSR